MGEERKITQYKYVLNLNQLKCSIADNFLWFCLHITYLFQTRLISAYIQPGHRPLFKYLTLINSKWNKAQPSHQP